MYLFTDSLFRSVLIVVLLIVSLFPNGSIAEQLVLESQSTDNVNRLQATQHLDSIVLGGGCFWGAEKMYAALTGVVDSVTGFAGGTPVDISQYPQDNYSDALIAANHAEVVKVTFNREKISLAEILKVFFESHDPTQLNRQGADVGASYRSIILFNSTSQKVLAEKLMKVFQLKLTQAKYGKIVTQIQPLKEFYLAEERHQDYLVKNPTGYCPDHRTGVVFDTNDKVKSFVDNSELVKGKSILVIEAEFCPFCEKFKKEVGEQYQHKIPLFYRQASQLAGLSIQSPTWATPTFIFLKEGKEVFSLKGYYDKAYFYQALKKFDKL
ncbi:peptide-methionine (S)-S-oxide reductase MsrA [Aliikangiella sp. IMCC44359]|uniref:peptide-methionine (S)-S-oxide reductase MsrA n=1 Tax=Aliikangiella sp. IMCC44359 TaxID=3459125 RepID=UPI00403AC011